jgi:glycosyltransferase involved in cell wall biosynthesis
VTQRLRILHLMRAPVGGLFRHVLDLAAEQVACGHEVGILADATAYDALTDRRFAAIAPKLALGLKRLAMSRKPGLGDLSAARAVAAHAATLDLDVLHGHGAKGGAYARLAGRLARGRGGRRLKVFYTPHGGTLNFPNGSLEGRVYLRMEWLLAGQTSGIIFESDFARRTFAEKVGRLKTPQRVVHNGLQPADFAPHAPAADAADFVFIGELRDIKGVDVLLKALRQLNDEQTVSALIVGSGPHAERFHAQARELRLDTVVRFSGALPAAEAFPLGRALAVPSLKESFPYVVLEGAAGRLPLVATSVGGIPEIVADTDTPLVPAGDDQALADLMRSVLREPAAAMARAGRLHDAVKAKFTVAQMTADILDFYAATDGR